MANLEIEIQKRKMLKPTIPTQNHLGTLKLSLFNQLAPRIYVPVLFHYLPNSKTDVTITSETCDKLQKSLMETLTKFYPLAGRFREDELSIYCNDEGVEYVETKVVNADLAELLHQGSKNIELLNDFLPWRSTVPPYSDVTSSPLLGVQVNVFHCGGLVIGIQISHIIADAFTLATFVNEWAHTSLTGTPKEYHRPPSFSHLSSLFPTRLLLGPRFSPPPPNNIPYKIVTRRFVFDALAIANLKNTIELDSRPTRVVVVMSLIWKVLTSISTAKHGHSRDSCLSFPINLRGKSNLPSLEHALGNCATIGIVNINREARKELNEFVNLVGRAIGDICVGIGKASVDDITSMCITCVTEIVNKFGQNDVDIYSSTSWCRFPWYEADFGWGKPSWVSSVSKKFEGINLIDTKDGDGIEAWVGLKENDMIQFERHPDILFFTSEAAFDSSF